MRRGSWLARLVLVALCLGLLWPVPCEAQPLAFVQDVYCDVTGSADPVTCAYSGNVTAGTLLWVVVSIPSNTTTIVGVTDTIGNTWVLAKSQVGAAAETIATYCVTAGAGAGANTVSIDLSTTSIAMIAVGEFSGQSGTGACNDQPDNGADESADATWNPGSVTPNQANDLVVAGYRGTTAQTVMTPPSGYTAVDAGALGRFVVYWKIKTGGDSAAENPTVVYDATETGSAIVSLFKEAAAAAGGCDPTGMLGVIRPCP